MAVTFDDIAPSSPRKSKRASRAALSGQSGWSAPKPTAEEFLGPDSKARKSVRRGWSKPEPARGAWSLQDQDGWTVDAPAEPVDSQKDG